MDYKAWLIAWVIFAVSVVYWDMHRWEDTPPISECHNVKVKVINNQYLCTECNKYCKPKKKGH